MNCRYKIQQLGSQKIIIKKNTKTVLCHITKTIKANGKENHCKLKYLMKLVIIGIAVIGVFPLMKC